MDDPSQHAPRRLQISLGEAVRDFMQVNHLVAQVGHSDIPDKNNYAVAVDVIADTGPIISGITGYFRMSPSEGSTSSYRRAALSSSTRSPAGSTISPSRPALRRYRYRIRIGW